MRSKGSRFTLGVWGWRCVRSTLRLRPRPFATVRNRPQPSATVRNRPQPLPGNIQIPFHPSGLINVPRNAAKQMKHGTSGLTVPLKSHLAPSHIRLHPARSSRPTAWPRSNLCADAPHAPTGRRCWCQRVDPWCPFPESCEATLANMVAAKRTAALDHWRARMRDMQCAARWVRHSDLPSPCFLNSDGSPAMNPKEQGHAISRERMPRWTESPEAALPAQLNQTQAFAASLASEATPFMAPPVWNLTDIIAALRTSAAGLDGLTFQHFRSLDQIYLQALAFFFTALDLGMPFPSSWSQARLVCIPKEDGGTRPLAVLLVVYRMWASRAARILAEWCKPWFLPQLIGGLRGSPPASATASLFGFCLF